MGRPNIFNYATSELSQDAFICWLVSWINSSEDSALTECARAFVAFLYNLRHKNDPISPQDVVRILDGYPDRQFKRNKRKIDVIFVVTIRNKVEETEVLFILEDKTDTSPHSNQLSDYLNITATFPCGERIPLLLKTGYVWPEDEQETARLGYELLACGTWYRFLSRFSIKNEIYLSYLEHLKERYFIPQTTYFQDLLASNAIERFEKDFVQFEYLKRVKEKCSEYIGTTELKHSTNLGGTRFTTYYFILYHNVYIACRHDPTEYIYYRIDIRTNKDKKEYGYYISLVQYADVKKANHTEKEKKRKRLHEYRRIIQAVLNNMNGEIKICSSQPIADNRGKNEGTIGIWFFDKEKNTPNAILNDIPKIHRCFVEKVKEKFGDS